jgi:acetyltransferase-like isoleucine patch superfamily enzyme
MTYKNVIFGKECTFIEPCIIGLRPRGFKKNKKTFLGDFCIIQPFSCIFCGAKIGNNFFLGVNSLVREDNQIGNNVSIGSGCTLGPKNIIKDRVRIHSGCFLETCVIEEDVFVGPNVVFTNDKYPPSKTKRNLKGAIVKKGASIGANSTILPQVTIGEYSLVGAGSVVTKDVAPYTIVAGNPARIVKNKYEVIKRKFK